MVPDGDIVALVTYDDATTNLSVLAKRLMLHTLGAKRVEDFAAKFRSSYYLVARKREKEGGISGSGGGEALLENLSTPTGKEYGKQIEFSGCLRL